MADDTLATENIDIPVFFLAPEMPITQDAEPAFFCFSGTYRNGNG